RMKRRLDAAMLDIARQERGAKGAILAWRLHDLRRTCITGMAELGIRPDVIELTVNHVSGSRGGIARVYNRSEMLDERNGALEPSHLRFGLGDAGERRAALQGETLRTWIQQARIPKDVRSAVQNHFDGDMDVLYGHYTSRRKSGTLEAWARHLKNVIADNCHQV